MMMSLFFGKLTAFFTVILIIPFLAGCGRGEGKEKTASNGGQERVVKVSIQEIIPHPMKDILVLPGHSEPWLDILVPSDMAGRIEWLGPREGAKVRKGELIARVDSGLLKAALDRAEAAFSLTESLLKRRKELRGRNIINQEELDRSVTEYSLAEGALRHARIEYEKSFVKAPADGHINYVYADEGEFIDRGKPLVHLVNIDRVKITINVPELDVSHVSKGQDAIITIDAFPGKTIHGSFDFIAFKADPATKTFPVRAVIENPHHEIRPGMIARVALIRKIAQDALSAPMFSLVERGGERLIFIEKNGIARARTISIGIIEQDRVQITGGLSPGDRLIVAGQSELEDGTKVLVQ
ncbi:MAG: efflux transporter periplasmic adaptor subunit [Deltaproteobacteria bacterium CG_4_8_14_3_um_filter_51_11]|nr:MAG: efflux transporter periplasmic adaptor subunit [Deltaproteobacteria bacterium CG23_combo_of_CG06-09_8_20_14_all_51_20]PIX18526.1 MAG: efflux transporter periplasmic adaptor subunit [Deltaproteobacteria bacterium CG_4_8_14_3_um_filter_51_11]